MAQKALWVLHYVRDESISSKKWRERFYELNDLEEHEDRPYAPYHIDTDKIPGSWGVPNRSTGSMEYMARCHPLRIDDNNIITVFNFPEGEMGKAIKAVECASQKRDLSKSSGSSP